MTKDILDIKRTDVALNKVIVSRRSSRSFLGKRIPLEKINRIIEAGLTAPSGKNGQPWKIAVIYNDKELLEKIASLTIYEPFVKTSDCLIAVFLDRTQSYHYIKDIQAIGAFIENILLEAADLNIGSCWIGEILNKQNEVIKLLELDAFKFELMAVIALGYSDDKAPQPQKKSLQEVLLKFL